MRVDLPAPFSPTTACTSPGMTRSATSWLATTPGNLFVMPDSSTAGTPAVASAGGRSAVCSAILSLRRRGGPEFCPRALPDHSLARMRTLGVRCAGDFDLPVDDL